VLLDPLISQKLCNSNLISIAEQAQRKRSICWPNYKPQVLHCTPLHNLLTTSLEPVFFASIPMGHSLSIFESNRTSFEGRSTLYWQYASYLQRYIDIARSFDLKYVATVYMHHMITLSFGSVHCHLFDNTLKYLRTIHKIQIDVVLGTALALYRLQTVPRILHD
jgi:hypothetical protein